MGAIRDDDKKIINKVLRGEKGAARKFYQLYHQRIKRFISSRTRSIEDAEEIVQDTFLSAIESLALYSGTGKLISWLYAIARHEISDYYRKKRVKTLVMSHAPILAEILGDDNWKTQYERIAVQEQIKLVLKNIFPRYALVLKMKYLEGWSVQDMADELKETLKATETALFRARKAFALEWNKLENPTALSS
jgi:RNA polymerase sigma-70 factor, ECF subfamily